MFLPFFKTDLDFIHSCYTPTARKLPEMISNSFIQRGEKKRCKWLSLGEIFSMIYAFLPRLYSFIRILFFA